MATYDDILGFREPNIDEIVGLGRTTLQVNDTLMRASQGDDASVYTGCIRSSVEVAMVNLSYAILHQDWKLVGVALAALELALSRPDLLLGQKALEIARGKCGEINCVLRSMSDEDWAKLVQDYPLLGGPMG